MASNRNPVSASRNKAGLQGAIGRVKKQVAKKRREPEEGRPARPAALDRPSQALVRSQQPPGSWQLGTLWREQTRRPLCHPTQRRPRMHPTPGPPAPLLDKGAAWLGETRAAGGESGQWGCACWQRHVISLPFWCSREDGHPRPPATRQSFPPPLCACRSGAGGVGGSGGVRVGGCAPASCGDSAQSTAAALGRGSLRRTALHCTAQLLQRPQCFPSRSSLPTPGQISLASSSHGPPSLEKIFWGVYQSVVDCRV